MPPGSRPTGSARSRSAARIEYEVRANWKVVVENFMECYHCAPMHPELVRLLPAFRSGATQEYGLGTRLADDAEALTMSGRAPRPAVSRASRPATSGTTTGWWCARTCS